MSSEASRGRALAAGLALALLVALLAPAAPVRAFDATAPTPANGTTDSAAPGPRLVSIVPSGGEEAPEARFEEQIGVSWILVPVSVKNRRGHVRGLKRGDFQLRVDGKVVPFADFEARGEVPWSIVFLQDLSGSMAISGKLDRAKAAIASFLDQARPGDEFALASFAGDVTAIDVPFTENQQPLREALARWEAYGKTAIHDAVSLLPEISGDSRNVKRAVILITDGADNASRIPPNQAREIVRHAQLPVYVLGLESGDPYEVSAKGEKLSRYADVLNLLSFSTGGRYLPVSDLDGLARACTSIAEELRWQYVLGFETEPAGQNRFREISVAVARRGVEVAFRRGYRGTAPGH